MSDDKPRTPRTNRQLPDLVALPDDALVTRKDPMDFMRRLAFYHASGSRAFGGAA